MCPRLKIQQSACVHSQSLMLCPVPLLPQGMQLGCDRAVPWSRHALGHLAACSRGVNIED